MKFTPWTPEHAVQELNKRFSFARECRAKYEDEWRRNELTVFASGAEDSSTGAGEYGEDTPVPRDFIKVNYVMKNFRYVHSQFSMNPPSVVPRPTSNDPEDHRRADAADRVARFALRQYKLQERHDMAVMFGLLYGTGFYKGIQDPQLGEAVEFDESTGEIIMTGDYYNKALTPWTIFADPDAETWDEVKWLFEEIFLDFDTACLLVGDDKDKLEELKKYRLNEQSPPLDDRGSKSNLKKSNYDTVRCVQYWEKGLPANGLIGRFCWCLLSGEKITPLTDCVANPHSFSRPLRKGEAPGKTLPKVARLPYHIFTDLDMPNTYYGKSIVGYSGSLQDAVNKIDNTTLECLSAHGVARIILPEDSEISDESITNSPWDIIKITGNQPPHFMEPMPLPASLPQFREVMRQGIDDCWGVNENMFGNQSREQSGFSMEYATQQGNSIRRRLFNKYVSLVEAVYKDIFDIVREFWTESRSIGVLGNEKAFEVSDIKGSDISGGFDIVVEYGTSLSLDPMQRRKEIISLAPLFEKAGMSPRAMLRMMKLNELDGMYDIMQLADDRQREIFTEMCTNEIYIAPEELQDHKNMLEVAYTYIMTAEFKYLSKKCKALIIRHVKEREALAAKGASPEGSAPTAGPMGAEPAPAGEAPSANLGAMLGLG